MRSANHPNGYSQHQFQPNGGSLWTEAYHPFQTDFILHYIRENRYWRAHSECRKCNDTLRLNNEKHVVIFPVATWKASVTRYDICISIPRAFRTNKSPLKPKSNASFACMQYVLGFVRNEVTIQRLLSASIYITQVYGNYAVCTLVTLSNMLIDYSTSWGDPCQ